MKNLIKERSSQAVSCAYLKGASYEVGSLRPISEIEELKKDTNTLDTLLTLGLETFSLSTKKPVELAKSSIEKTVDRAGVDRSQIDEVIYATSGYAMSGKPWCPVHYSKELNSLLLSLNLSHCTGMGVSFSQCVNIIAAIELAVGLVESGRKKNVLVFSADCLSPHESRLVDNGISVISDAAASCIVSSEQNNGYFIEAINKNIDWGLLEIDSASDFSTFFKRTAEGISGAVQQLNQSLGRVGSDYEQLLTNSVNLSILRIISRQTKVDVDRIYSKNISRFAHCDCSDILINLADYELEKEGEKSDPVLLLASGPYVWGAMSLVRMC